MLKYAVFDKSKQPRKLLKVVRVGHRIHALHELKNDDQILLVYGKLTSLERRAVDKWLAENEKPSS
jgi:hypothetical protein